MADRVRRADWTAHPLGHPDKWPQSLKVVLRVLLTSPQPLWLAWGPELTFFCNDASLPLLGSREWTLGASARRVWAEQWSSIGPRVDSVVRTGHGASDEGLLLPPPPPAPAPSAAPPIPYTFSYCAASNDDGSVGGVLCVVTQDFSRAGARRTTPVGMPVGIEDTFLRARQPDSKYIPASTESPLAQSEERYRQLVHSLPAAVYTCDAEGRIQFYNDAAARMWGRRPEPGKELWCGSLRIFTTDGRPLPHDACPMAIALKEGRPVRGEEIVVERPDGARRYVLPYPQPIFDSQGALVGAVNMLVDVTAHKLADQQLAATREDLSLEIEALKRLHNLSMKLMASQELTPGLEAITQTLVELHGARFGLLSLRDTPSGRLLPGASVGFNDDFSVALLTPGPTMGSCGHAFATGKRTVIEDIETDPRFEGSRTPARRAGFRSSHSTPIRTRSGDILGVLSVHFQSPRLPTARETQLADMCAHHAADLIEAARTQQALRDIEQRFSAFMEHLPGAAWIKDVSGRYLYANPECGRIFPVAPEDMRGLTDADVFPPETARQFIENDRRAVAGGKAVQVVELLRQPDGKVHHSIVSKFPIPGADGRTALVGGVGFDITDRVIAEAQRRESAALLEGSLDALSSHIAILDCSGVIIKVNEAWRRFAADNGCSEAACGPGMTYLDSCEPHCMPSGDADLSSASAAAGLRDVIEGRRESFVLEYPCHAPSQRRWFTMRVTRFGEGESRRIVVSHEDVTERHDAEEAIRESAERLRLATDATHLGTWDYDLVTDRLMWDERCRELFGVPPGADVDYALFLRAVHPDDREHADESVKRALNPVNPQAFDIEYRVIGISDHVERWLRATGRAFWHGGRACRFIGTVEDITELKNSLESLRRSEEMLRLATDAAGVGTWALNIRTGRMQWSPKLEEIVGLPTGGFGGYERDFFDLIHPGDHDLVKAAVERAIAARSEYKVEFRYRHVSGTYRWMVGRGRAWYDDAGHPVTLAGTGEDITHRKRSDGALRESEERFRQMADYAPVMVWVTEADGACSFLSKSWYEFTGQSPATALGFGWTDAVHPDDRDRSREVFMAATRDGTPFRTEFRLRRMDGEYRWAIDAAAPRFGEEGQFLGFIGSVIDITDRKEAEAALATSEEQFRTLADSIPQLAWMARPDGRITWYNKRWFEYTGTTLEQMNRSGWLSVVDPKAVDRVTATYKAAIAEGKTWEDTFALRREDGEMRWHLAQAMPLRDDHGRIVRWFGTNTDITAQREAEESLRLSEERFRLMADSAPTLIWIAGTNKLRSWFNKPWLNFTGRTMEQETGAGWVEGVHPEDMERCLQVYSEAFEGRGEFQMEYRLRRHDGEYRWMLARGLPLYSAGGKFAGLIGSCVDTTDQVQARLTLERQQVLLEEAVRARTAELQASNERLRLAERMASLGTLSAGLGHDMGNLLVPLRVRLESLAKAGLPPDLREDVEAIRSSADYLQRLASGLRMLAIDPGRMARNECAEIVAWWSEVEPLMRNALPKGVHLSARMPANACRVSMSRAALTQAVFNLVQNAGDAMRARGKGNVTVWAEVVGDAVRVGVTDDGPGMSPEVKTRCMEPFYTTKTRGISTGLGLALVYGLAREAGGSVEIESARDHGTTFVITLRAAGAPEKTGQGKRAIVHLRDPRLRALVTAELRAMEFSVQKEDADMGTVDLFVGEDASAAPSVGASRSVVLLSDDPVNVQPGMVVLGAKPRLQAIRDVLRRIVNEGR